MSGALVELEGVAKGFGTGEARVQALVDITLAVAAGEVVGLRGPSGSGKSTLLNLVACILEPDAGMLRLAGEAIGFIFQFLNLLPFLDATDNVALAMTLNGVPLAEARRRAREQSAAVLVVTHDDKILSRFDRLVSLRDGRIEGETRPAAATG